MSADPNVITRKEWVRLLTFRTKSGYERTVRVGPDEDLDLYGSEISLSKSAYTVADDKEEPFNEFIIQKDALEFYSVTWVEVEVHETAEGQPLPAPDPEPDPSWFEFR